MKKTLKLGLIKSSLWIFTVAPITESIILRARCSSLILFVFCFSKRHIKTHLKIAGHFLVLKFYCIVSECTNYLAQPQTTPNGKPVDPAYDLDVASK